MFVVLKSGLAAKLPISGVAKELCKVSSKNNLLQYQTASLTRAAFRDENEVPNIKPFPYHEKPYHVLNMLLDTNKCRVHKHTKLIVLDGPIASGKNALAQELAKEFDFLYLPQPTFDDLYITHWGFDVRTLDHKLSKNSQSWDIERFCQSPLDINTASMQIYMLMLRQKFYMEALAHLFCTGQGVVTVRSPWSDAVFAKAMAQSKYISPGAFEAHTDCCEASLFYYLKPHLVIYLDVPVKNTMQNIVKRGRPYEQNAKALTEKYLSDIEENYKRDYLAKLSVHSHMLIYDWSQGGDVEVVVEDIENLKFEEHEHETEEKLADWKLMPFEHKIHTKHFTADSQMYLHNMDIMRTDVPELLETGTEMEKWDEVWNEVPDAQYAPGYNFLKGDKNILWKTKGVYSEDRVTPLMAKYYERKQREKEQIKSTA